MKDEPAHLHPKLASVTLASARLIRMVLMNRRLLVCEDVFDPGADLGFRLIGLLNTVRHRVVARILAMDSADFASDAATSDHVVTVGRICRDAGGRMVARYYFR